MIPILIMRYSAEHTVSLVSLVSRPPKHLPSRTRTLVDLQQPATGDTLLEHSRKAPSPTTPAREHVHVAATFRHTWRCFSGVDGRRLRRSVGGPGDHFASSRQHCCGRGSRRGQRCIDRGLAVSCLDPRAQSARQSDVTLEVLLPDRMRKLGKMVLVTHRLPNDDSKQHVGYLSYTNKSHCDCVSLL